MSVRCLPNDRCLIIAEVPGCECNIGAHVTVEALAPIPVGMDLLPVWTFRDADRPLLSLDEQDGKRVESMTDGEPHLSLADRPVIFDHHIVPLRDIGGACVDDVAARTPAPA
jgi:hypothetical protein